MKSLRTYIKPAHIPQKKFNIITGGIMEVEYNLLNEYNLLKAWNLIHTFYIEKELNHLVVEVPTEKVREMDIDIEKIDMMYRDKIESDYNNVRFISTEDRGIIGPLGLSWVFVITFTGVMRFAP